MTGKEVQEIVDRAVDSWWEDMRCKPPEFWSMDMGIERMENIISAAVHDALEVAVVKVTAE